MTLSSKISAAMHLFSMQKRLTN